MPASAGIFVSPPPRPMMEQLWSPWRSAYIASDQSSEGCFLCKAAAPDAEQRLVLVVARFEFTIVLLNRYPYNAGHLLIAPKEHTGNLGVLPTAQAHELMDVTQVALRVLQAEMRPQGVNLGGNLGAAAGAGVPDHLHIHLVPRWNGDTNFMPVIGEVKVVSEQIDEIWDRFSKAFCDSTSR